MASVLQVEELRGSTTGANANKIIIPSGQTLDASGGGFLPSSGQIIQVVEDVWTNVISDNSSAWVSVKNLSITPKLNTSKIHVFFNASMEVFNDTNIGVGVRLLGDASGVDAVLSTWDYEMYDSLTNSQRIGTKSYIHIDDANTTNTVTYYLQLKSQRSGFFRINNYGKSVVTLMEIAG